ncbi:MAG: peptidase E [Gammaproteobacteria bacterium]|nr:peptidase E [Gammaproteobacteria bacterium]
MRQIIAIGGGGFGREIKDLKIENYIISQSSKHNPSICFIPTATGDNSDYIDNFYKAFESLKCKTSHINFFKRTINLEKHINAQDIIFVGGGNTKSMLAVWREWSLDKILKKAYDNGTILSGVSAGAICWFTNGITDSWKDHQAILPCLDFVEGNFCPHYDEEPERIPYVKEILEKDIIKTCIAVEGFCALHLVNDIPKFVVSFGNKSNSYDVCCKDNKIIHNQIKGTTKIQL